MPTGVIPDREGTSEVAFQTLDFRRATTGTCVATHRGSQLPSGAASTPLRQRGGLGCRRGHSEADQTVRTLGVPILLKPFTREELTRLLSEYPRSPWEAEARAWQATLTDLLVREDEARRARLRLKPYEDESKRTKTNLEWLKQTDTELERRAR